LGKPRRSRRKFETDSAGYPKLLLTPERSTAVPDDVNYDKGALRDAEKKMHATGTGHADNPDPEGDHDPEALKDAQRKMTGRGK
jgi:hypothetical protein